MYVRLVGMYSSTYSAQSFTFFLYGFGPPVLLVDWRARNDFSFNNKVWATEAVSSKAHGDFYEFLDANTKGSPTPMKANQRETLVWQRPVGNEVKINVDATISRSTNTVGTGAIARGADGMVIGMLLTSHLGINSPRVAEALAIRDGLKLGIALHLTRISLESDAEAIVKSCLASQVPPFDIAVITQDCLILKNQFTSCVFKFVKRECNRAAHTCAQKALSNSGSGLWTSILPPWGSLLSDV